MALELLQDQSRAVTFYPASLDARPSSAVLSFKSPDGTEKAAPSVTVASISATVASVTSQIKVTLNNSTNLTVGAQVWLTTSDGWSGAIRIAEIETGHVVTFDTAPPGTLDTSATLLGLGLSATIPSSATTTRDRFYRLEWTITDANSTVSLLHQIAHVVRMQFSDPVSDSEAKRYVAANWPGLAASKDAGFYRGIVGRANQRVRNLIQASGDFPHMIGDPELFQSSGAGLAALRLELALMSLTPGDFEPAEYVSSTERDLKRAIRESMGNAYVDRDDSGSVTANDVLGMWTLRVARR